MNLEVDGLDETVRSASDFCEASLVSNRGYSDVELAKDVEAVLSIHPRWSRRRARRAVERDLARRRDPVRAARDRV